MLKLNILDRLQYRMMVMLALVSIIGVIVGTTFAVFVMYTYDEYLFVEFYYLLIAVGIMSMAMSMLAIAVKRK